MVVRSVDPWEYFWGYLLISHQLRDLKKVT